MCKFNIQFETSKHIGCLSFEQCADNCKRKKILLVILLILSLTFLAVFVFGILIVVQNNLITFINGGWFESLLILSSLLIISTIQVLSTYFLFAKFFLYRTAMIVKIGTIEAKGRSRSQSTCTSEANLITIDRRISNSQFAPMDIIPENLPIWMIYMSLIDKSWLQCIFLLKRLEIRMKRVLIWMIWCDIDKPTKSMVFILHSHRWGWRRPS